MSLGFACSLIEFEIEGDLSALVDLPLLIVHGRDNALHPVIEAEPLNALYSGPKDLLILDNAKHLDWMEHDAPAFKNFLAKVDHWVAANGFAAEVTN